MYFLWAESCRANRAVLADRTIEHVRPHHVETGTKIKTGRKILFLTTTRKENFAGRARKGAEVKIVPEEKDKYAVFGTTYIT